MIHSITGTLTGKNDNGMYLLTNGIEWDIIISRNTYQQLPQSGEKCRVYVYLYHREDKLQLFGFHTPKEKKLFLSLIKVEGIGPSLAVKILSGITPDNFIAALEKQDTDLLTGIPGLGKKTAQKIIFKLAGKLSLDEAGTRAHADIIKALIGMGFEVKQVRSAVKEAASEIDENSLDTDEFEKKLLKVALVKLSK